MKTKTQSNSILLACAAALLLLGGSCAQKKQQQRGFSMPPMPVEVAEVTQGAMRDRFRAVGTIEAGEAVTVVAEIDAVVKALPFREGGAIARGGLIAQLDDAQPAAEAARAEALLAQSRSAYERVRAIVDQGAGAPQDLDDAAAAFKVAEANLAVAKARLEKTRITAPFDGIIGARRVSPGAFLRAGQAITELASIHEIRVSFTAPERYLGVLMPGSAVVVSTTAYPGEELSGTIDIIEPVLDPATRSARIIARVKNPGGRFKPGMSADVAAVLSERPDALMIPDEAVFAEGNQALVYTVGPDSTVMPIPITLGSRQADVVEVAAGLEPGARVVRAGHQKLFPGAKVLPILSQPGGGAGAASKETER